MFTQCQEKICGGLFNSNRKTSVSLQFAISLFVVVHVAFR